MLWSPAASSDRQRRRVLARVKVRRYAPPPLRGADNLDAGSAHALRLAPCLTMPNHDPLHLVVDDLSSFRQCEATVDIPTRSVQKYTVPHPVSWTPVYAMRLDAARVPRALRAACGTRLLEAPAPIVAFDEPSDGGAHFGQVSEDPAVDCLLLERAIPALDDPVGFRLLEEAEAGVDAPVPKLVPCV